MQKIKIWSGNFEVKNNLLYYLPKQSPDHNLKVEGKWAITKKGRLRFVVAHAQNQVFGKTITVGVELSRLDSGSLEFKAAKRVTMAGKNLNILVLNGELTALPGKKLAFTLEREGAIDTLKLDGKWDVYADNQIGFTIKRICDGKKITDSAVLNGSWQICGNTLVYQAEKSSRPFLSQEFEITRAIFTDVESGIDFTLGAGLRRQVSRRVSQDTISLKGVWKQDGAKAEFIFNSSKRQSFTFVLSRRLSDDKELVFELDTGEDKKPSFVVTFTKKINGDSSFFIRGRFGGKERRAEAGFRFPF